MRDSLVLLATLPLACARIGVHGLRTPRRQPLLRTVTLLPLPVPVVAGPPPPAIDLPANPLCVLHGDPIVAPSPVPLRLRPDGPPFAFVRPARGDMHLFRIEGGTRADLYVVAVDVEVRRSGADSSLPAPHVRALAASEDVAVYAQRPLPVGQGIVTPKPDAPLTLQAIAPMSVVVWLDQPAVRVVTVHNANLTRETSCKDLGLAPLAGPVPPAGRCSTPIQSRLRAWRARDRCWSPSRSTESRASRRSCRWTCRWRRPSWCFRFAAPAPAYARAARLVGHRLGRPERARNPLRPLGRRLARAGRPSASAHAPGAHRRPVRPRRAHRGAARWRRAHRRDGAGGDANRRHVVGRSALDGLVRGGRHGRGSGRGPSRGLGHAPGVQQGERALAAAPRL